MRLKRGILSQADRNLLYVDEVNLLADEVVDAILDAAAQGSYTVRRGPLSATYRSRFALIGSMNPEEGRLRPQILDRFGLRLMIRGLEDPDDRLEAYRRVQAHLANPRETVARFAQETQVVQAEIENARIALPGVELPDEVARIGLEIIEKLALDTLRAEITLFEAARAHAAADQRQHPRADHDDRREGGGDDPGGQAVGRAQSAPAPSSASNAAVAAERLAAHDGHSSRVLHENASRYSSAQSGHRMRAKPLSKSPQSRYRRTCSS